MTTSDSDASTGLDTRESQVAIDELIAHPFPETESHRDEVFSGPGFHMLTLRYSQEFWEDWSPEAVESALAEIESHRSSLATELAPQWGAPHNVDLWPLTQPGLGNAPGHTPIAYLSPIAGNMLLWRRPELKRWLGLALCQEDKELPIELVAVIGILETMPPNS